MKKIIISTISVSLFLSAFFAVKSVASIDEVGLFNANVEALADGEEAVTGHCEEKDKVKQSLGSRSDKQVSPPVFNIGAT